MRQGDPGWLSAYDGLLVLHTEKSATYGTDDDRLANFTKLGEAANQPPERYAVERLIEKAIRALHMIDAGEAGAVKEYPDLASLALCAEALRRRPKSYDGTHFTRRLDWSFENRSDVPLTVTVAEPRCIP